MHIDKVIAGCKRNKRRAQNELYKQFYPLMHNIVFRYSKDHSNIGSLINAGFYKVYKSIDSYNDKHALATWMRNIMVNTCIDEYRKNARKETHIELEENTKSVELIVNDGEQVLQSKDVMELVNQLGDVAKNVFNLAAIDGYSHTEIAEKMNISAGASRWHLHQARLQLKDKINNRLAKENKSIEAAR